MDPTAGGDWFLARYHSLLLSSKLQDGTASEKADCVRNVLSQLQCAKLAGSMGNDVADCAQKQYEDMYANIVDSFDEQSGLNNFAGGALSICSGYKNESSKWQSSLTIEKVKAMKCVQQAAWQTQKHSLIGSKNPGDLVPTSRTAGNKENIPITCQQGNSASVSNHDNIRSSARPVSSLPPPQLPSDPGDRVMNLYGNVISKLSTGGEGQMRCDEPTAPALMRNNRSAPGYRNDQQPGDNRESRFGAPVNRQPLFSSGRNQYDPPMGMNSKEIGQKRSYQQSSYVENEGERSNSASNVFRTAKQQLDIDNQRKYGGGQSRASVNTASYGTGKKSLGTRRGLNSKFVPPVMNRDEEEEFGNQAANTITRAVLKTGDGSGPGCNMEGMDEDKLKGIEPKMVELIMNEIMDSGPPMTWDDVAGLEFAKKTIKEIVVWPMLRPDIFTGLRGPPKGLLLFGPPGTGKTLIGKCIACQSKSTFFCISASSLTSKWVGEGEKMVRALFAVARARQPAVVFIDEIDSLLTQRTDGENEASRRIKTEFLVQLDGASTSSEDRLLVIGATNRPQEIDEAARRRFVKRLYIPLPEFAARKTIITNLLRQQAYTLSDQQLDDICNKTDGFSGADMATLCREAALGPIRDMSFGDIENISADQVRAICFTDFEDALMNVRPSVSDKDLDVYVDWNNTFGSGGR